MTAVDGIKWKKQENALRGGVLELKRRVVVKI
jgi:hypothetical protein